MEERNYKLYVHISPSNKRYYGITGLERMQDRWQNGEGYKHNRHFYNAINKYGWDNIQHIVLFNKLTQKEAQLLEQMYIALYDTTNGKYGYNKDLGGNVPSMENRRKRSESMQGHNNPFYGKHHTQETKDILRIKSTGRHHSEESKKKISAGLRNTWNDPNSTFNTEEFIEKRREAVTGEKNGMYGKHHSDETIEKMSEAHKGHEVSEETRRKMSEANKGHIVSEETRRKMSAALSGEHHPFYGKPAWNKGLHHTEEAKRKISEAMQGEKHPLYGKHHSEQTKKKISEAHKGKYKGSKSPNAKKIICVETGQIFGSIVEAKEWLGKGDINMCLRGKCHTAGGYHWEYVTEEQAI